MGAHKLKTWSTSPAPMRETGVWWKKSLGEMCPHGLEIFLVDGPYIRNTFDSDFVQGGNGQRYRFCSKRELWIDNSIPEDEWPYVALHECYETQLMSEGLDYDQAHDRAKRLENQWRRLNRPGEGEEEHP